MQITFIKKNNPSIFKFLVLSLTLFITCFMLVLSYINYVQVKSQNDTLFNAELTSTAKTIDILISSVAAFNPTKIGHKFTDVMDSNLMRRNVADNIFSSTATNDALHFESDIAILIFDLQNGKVVLRTENSPKLTNGFLHEGEGFQYISTTENHLTHVNDERVWYTYNMFSKNKHYKIIIFVDDAVKQTILQGVFVKSFLMLCILYLLLVIFAYVVVYIALKPIRQISRKIKKVNPRQIERIYVKKVPEEVVPIINQINDLFKKFQAVLDKEKRFSDDAAHELKTPITAIKAQAQLALRLNDIDLVKSKLNKIIDSSEKYTRIVEQLLMLSRMELNDDIVDAYDLELNKTIENILADLAITAISSNIMLSFFPSKETITMHSNYFLLDILIKNIVSNAIKYGNENGYVKVFTFVKDGQAIIKIKDNGIGISEENLKIIFNRFFREPGSNKKGSGLGLAIVQEIVRVHKGNVNIINNKNGGLTVTITLPIITIVHKKIGVD